VALGSGPQSPAVDDRLDRAERGLFEVRPESAVDVAGTARAAHADYQAARYDAVLDVLPRLLPALPGSTDPAAAAGWTVAAKTFTELGRPGPALVAADRGWAVSRTAGDPADIGMTAREVAAALLVDDRPAAEHVATGTAELVGGDDPARISVEGALWLLAAVIAARNGAAGLAGERLDRADRLAQRLGVDADHRWTAFGPTNVAIHRVSVAVELGDVDAAVAAADGIDLERLPPVLRSRRTQVQVDLAWAYGRRRRDADALIALLEVEGRTPEAVRRNVQAADTVRALLGRARGPRAGAVRALADRVGVVG
jgi:hypothetical protein